MEGKVLTQAKVEHANSCSSSSSAPLILITGGQPSTSYRSVEVLNADGSQLYSLPDLPEDMYFHSQSGTTLCGEVDCFTLSCDGWKKSHTLLQPRKKWPFLWMSSRGSVIIGGDTDIVEKLNDNGESQELYKMKEIMDYSCGISLEDKVIMTGGTFTGQTVRFELFSFDRI